MTKISTKFSEVLLLLLVIAIISASITFTTIVFEILQVYC